MLLLEEQNWSSVFSPFQSLTLASSIPPPPAHGSTCASSKTRSRQCKVVPSSLPPVPCPQFHSFLSPVCCPASLPVPCLQFPFLLPCPKFPVSSLLLPACLPVLCSSFLPLVSCPSSPVPQFPVQFAASSSLSQVPYPQFAASCSCPPVPCPQFSFLFALFGFLWSVTHSQLD